MHSHIVLLILWIRCIKGHGNTKENINDHFAFVNIKDRGKGEPCELWTLLTGMCSVDCISDLQVMVQRVTDDTTGNICFMSEAVAWILPVKSTLGDYYKVSQTGQFEAESKGSIRRIELWLGWPLSITYLLLT